jgi:hypothetical protein
MTSLKFNGYYFINKDGSFTGPDGKQHDEKVLNAFCETLREDGIENNIQRFTEQTYPVYRQDQLNIGNKPLPQDAYQKLVPGQKVLHVGSYADEWHPAYPEPVTKLEKSIFQKVLESFQR